MFEIPQQRSETTGMMVAKPITFPEPRPRGQLAKRFREEDHRNRRRRDNVSLQVALMPVLLAVVTYAFIMIAGTSAVSDAGGGATGGYFWILAVLAVPVQILIGICSIILANSVQRRWVSGLVSLIGPALLVLAFVLTHA